MAFSLLVWASRKSVLRASHLRSLIHISPMLLLSQCKRTSTTCVHESSKLGLSCLSTPLQTSAYINNMYPSAEMGGTQRSPFLPTRTTTAFCPLPPLCLKTVNTEDSSLVRTFRIAWFTTCSSNRDSVCSRRIIPRSINHRTEIFCTKFC